MAAYVVLAGIMIVRHEPWFDEAQAWLLARDASAWSLFADLLRYEGSPGLWHVILLAPAKLGLPYVSLHVIAAVAGAFTTYLILWRSPFPPLVQAVLPFTYFVFYQYVVVARSYALLAPLLFLVAIVWPQRTRQVYRFTLLLVLLANVSAHGALIAGSLLAFHLFEVVRMRRTLGRETLRRQFLAASGFGVVTVLLFLELRPPSDLSNPIDREIGLSSLRTLGELVDGAGTGLWPISLLALLAALWWFWRSGVLMLFLVPGSVLAAFAVIVYGLPWHIGILFLLTLFVLWISLADGPRPRATGQDLWARRAALTALVVVVGAQTIWSASSVRYDLNRSYSGSVALARYIKAHGDGRTIYLASFTPRSFVEKNVSPSWGGFPALAVQPYFDRNVFANYHDGKKASFWEWKQENGLDPHSPTKIVAAKPDWVVLNVKFRGSPKQPKRFPGYRVRASFPGALAFKTSTFEREAFLLLERRGAGAAVPTR